MSGGVTPLWWSPGAVNMPLPIVELAFLRDMHKSGDFDEARHLLFSETWFSVATYWSRRKAMAKHPSRHLMRQGCFFAFGSACGSAVVAWPATHERLQGCDYIIPKVNLLDQQLDIVPLLSVFDPTLWWAMHYDVLSPADWVQRLWLSGGIVGKQKYSGLRFTHAEKPDTLWRVAVRLHVGDLSLSVLKQFTAYFDVGKEAVTLLEHLEALIAHTL